MNLSALTALSPLDGRYASRMAALRPLLSEFGLMHRRVQVEIEWFIALSDAGLAEFKPLPAATREFLRALVTDFSERDAQAIKDIEKTTNHDVKAVEYWIKQQFAGKPELEGAGEFVHFACTSEDINNTSHGLMLKAAREQVILPALDRVIAKMTEMAQAHAAALYYLLHSTWVVGGLFLLADLIARQRGDKAGALVQGPALENPGLLGGLFFLGAIAVVGLPPLSGFLGKLLLLQALPSPALWGVLLLGGFAVLVALSRAGSTLFWRVGLSQLDSAELDKGRLLAATGLLLMGPLLVAFAEPALSYVAATVTQLHDLESYRMILHAGGAS